MSDAHEREDLQKFTAAVRALNTGSYARSLALGSMLASARGRPEFEKAARIALAPRAGELDLHINGDAVVNHSANAAAFGVFVKKLADSVKIVSREALGRGQMPDDLLVEAGPGSVRVIFRTPDPVPYDAIDGNDDTALWSDANEQSVALRTIADLLARAEPDSDGAAAVDGMVEQLPPKSRPALVAALASINSQGWSIEGEFRQRALGIQPIKVSPTGAARLKMALQVKHREKKPLTVSGHFDGHRRGRSLCWFIPDGGREITAFVPTPELMHEVAAFAQDEDHRVVASFTVLTWHGPGQGDSGTTTFTLDRVEDATPADTPLELGLS